MSFIGININFALKFNFWTMRLLLISNSTNAGEEYLAYPMKQINNFLGPEKHSILFIPYAGITISYDDYANRVLKRFNEIGQDISSVHTYKNKEKAVEEAEIIVVGGGNTWQLLHLLQKYNLVNSIRNKVLSGTPYIGWSAGSNLCCPTIRTTNDMPVVQPESFNAFNLVPFQINPHYLDGNPAGHAGETREDRIREFILVNQDIYVVGLREGTMLTFENNSLNLIGKRNARIFRFGMETKELSSADDLNFLLK
jgi:dipeptidase E